MRILVLLLLALSATPARADESLSALFDQAAEASWQRRWAAVQALSRLGQDDRVFKVRLALIKDDRPRVREAVAWATRLEPALGNATLLAKALRDRAPAVRRAAAQALLHFKDRRAVTALVAALRVETDARTRLHIVETLRAITPAPCLLDAEAWDAWWKKNAHDPRFRPADEAPRKGEYNGIVLETRTVAPIPTKGAPKRKPPHVLVLPPFGWNTSVFGPYLMPLRTRAAITWVRLPSTQSLTGRSGYGDDIAVYPVARLVKALDEFRAALKIDRFVILGVGASGWIAMRYAVTHRARCAGLVLVDTALDKAAYVDALQRGAAHGDPGERFAAKTLMHQNSAPFNRATLDRLHRDGLRRGFHDGADLEIAWRYHHAREPQGFATVPEIKWSRHRSLATPTLFLYSGASAFSGHRNATRIQRHFPKSLVAPLARSRGLPFIDDNTEFHRVVAAYLKRYDLG